MAPPDVAPGGGTVGPDVARFGDGDTTHLCAMDADGLGVSLTQSNALDFGSHLVEPTTGVFLHNRGVGFSLEPGHPAEVGPGRRPPHTLSPMLVTGRDGALSHLVGAMGGDAQPQIIVQLLARLLRTGQDPATAITAPRLTLDAPSAGPFRLWWGEDLTVLVEADAPAAWQGGLAGRGHRVRTISAFDPVAVGCAQIIAASSAIRPADRRLVGASDPRSPDGAARGPLMTRTRARAARGRAVGAPLRIASLAKQVPTPESLQLQDGRLVRAGVALEMNAYCRRAVAEGVTLARDSGGTCTVVTLGPPSAEDVLREAVAWGADAGLHACDPAFAGSDTLATARALAAVLAAAGPFDLVLLGRNSLDGETGQVGPELAELLDLPFASGVRRLGGHRDRCWRLAARARRRDAGGGDRAARRPLGGRAPLRPLQGRPRRAGPPCPAARLTRMDAARLGPGALGGAPAARRVVGATRTMEHDRARARPGGPLAESRSRRRCASSADAAP